MKICIDKKCRRSGVNLSLSEFPKNQKRKDKRNPYCKECSTRRIHEYRQRKRDYKKALSLGQFRRAERVQRKPMAVSIATKKILDTVTLAVEQGLKTRQQIHVSTKLSYDEIGDALAALWDVGSVKIVKLGDEKVFVRAA